MCAVMTSDPHHLVVPVQIRKSEYRQKHNKACSHNEIDRSMLSGHALLIRHTSASNGNPISLHNCCIKHCQMGYIEVLESEFPFVTVYKTHESYVSYT